MGFVQTTPTTDVHSRRVSLGAPPLEHLRKVLPTPGRPRRTKIRSFADTAPPRRRAASSSGLPARGVVQACAADWPSAINSLHGVPREPGHFFGYDMVTFSTTVIARLTPPSLRSHHLFGRPCPRAERLPAAFTRRGTPSSAGIHVLFFAAPQQARRRWPGNKPGHDLRRSGSNMIGNTLLTRRHSVERQVEVRAH